MKATKQLVSLEYHDRYQTGDAVQCDNGLSNGVIRTIITIEKWRKSYIVQIVASAIWQSGTILQISESEMDGKWIDGDIPNTQRDTYTAAYRAHRDKYHRPAANATPAQRKAFDSYCERHSEFSGWIDPDRQAYFENPPAKLQTIWDKAIAAFPYEFDYSGDQYGDFDETGDIEYGEEYVFKYGEMGGIPVEAGGWIDLRRQGTDVTVSCWFGLALNGDFQEPSARVGGEYDYLQAWYDLDSETWSEFTIDSI